MIRVAVGVILRDGRVLACQRRRDAKYPLKWEFPGGKLEAGESPTAAVTRELHEELGIRAVVEREMLCQDWSYDTPASEPGSTKTFRVHYMLVTEFSGNLENRAFEQIRWVTPQELERLDNLEGNQEAVAMLVRLAGESHFPQHNSVRTQA
jgi:8-oxo-dGTP diphosphatase